jgi:Na+-driven multidrug efflux pump
MGGGVSSAVSRALGRGDDIGAAALAAHALVIGLVVGIGFSLFFHFFAEPILRALGGSGEVLDEAMIYAGVALTGTVMIWLLNTLASIVRGTGNMRVPSLTLLGVSAVQIALGGALGLGLGPVPRLGLWGVASGLVMGFGLGSAFLLWYLHSGLARITLRTSTGLNRPMFLDILKVGAVAALSPLQAVLTVLIMTKLVASFGTEALAGYGIGARLEFLLVPIVFAVGVASVPMVGMAVGAQNIARARQVAWTAAGIAGAGLGLIGIAATAVPRLWSGLFTADAGVLAAADLYLRWAGPGYAFLGIGLALYFASQGSGKILMPVLAATVRLAVVAGGGVWLATAGAPPWSMFALVSLSMLTYGAATAAAVYLTPWGNKARVAQVAQ